jgi:hypothetical protein
MRGEICLTFCYNATIHVARRSGLDQARLETLHLNKIDLENEVLMPEQSCGYIGEWTAEGLYYATSKTFWVNRRTKGGERWLRTGMRT